MKYLIMLLSLAALSLPAAAADQNSADEMEIFTDNAENCIHFAGEWDVSLPADQTKDIKKALDETCPPAKEQQKVLREKYRNDPEMLAKINEFDLGQ